MNDHSPVRLAMVHPRRLVLFALCLSLTMLLGGCPPMGIGGRTQVATMSNGPKLRAVEFNDPVTPTSRDNVNLAAAKNETVSFTLEISNLPRANEKNPPVLRLQPLRIGAGAAPEDRIEAAQYSAYQLLEMPVDLNRAGYVRHTGLEAASARKLPRALLPTPINNGQINLSSLRDPSQPRSATGRAENAAMPVALWIDLAIPVSAKPGDYQTTLEVLERGAVVSELVVNLRVYDFALPDERHLMMVGKLDWSSLRRLFPEYFETVQKELLSRKDPKFAEPVRILDQLVKLGQQHRAQVVIPQLQPQVKWPANAPPRVAWGDFDSVTLPWLRGDAFDDRIPLGYWPLPATEYLYNYDDKSRAQYWDAVAAHFDQLDLLQHSAVALEKPRPGLVSVSDTFKLSVEAAQVLAAHPRIRVNVPLEDDQVQFNNPNNERLIDPGTLDRLVTAAPGLVFNAPTGAWPKGLKHPPHWLRTDLPGLVPYAGTGGDERDVRLWTWLAFLRQAELIQWANTLPTYNNPDEPADPSDAVWFYPGFWFGVSEPVPTVQLKWVRRAQQDFEYLYLARQRGEVIRALIMARLITKPVEIPLTQLPDPTYALMCGTTDVGAWEAVKGLLAESIELRPPGAAADEAKSIDLNGRTLQWAVPQEKPLLLGRSTQWGWGANPQQVAGNWVDLRLGLDIYNAADQRLIGKLQWSAAPAGWQFHPQPTIIPPNLAISTYHIRRFEMDASINLDRVTTETRKPIDLLFINDLTSRESLLRVVAPVALSDRRVGRLKVDGFLDEWSEADALQSGPLVRMLNRPAIQKQELNYASTPSQIYSGWAQEDFYLAFKVNGVSLPANGEGKNFVDYQFRRAWDEDLVEVMVQAVYVGTDVGPMVHLICKPREQLSVERRANPKENANPWEAVVGEAIRYAVKTETKENNTIWRAELAIPWTAINDAKHQGVRPTLLRFNFIQHKNATGESASWAGPIDFGRDENFTGLLYLRDPNNPGMK